MKVVLNQLNSKRPENLRKHCHGFKILFGENIWHFLSGQRSVLISSLFRGPESPVSQATVAEAAERLEISARSVSSKLRKMGFEVELASAAAGKSFTEDQEATLSAFVTSNSGEYTYAQIAEHFEGGAFSAKSIQGKILSMELTDHVKLAPRLRVFVPTLPKKKLLSSLW